jgi:transcriptional regulator with XRE-family HTH domain
MTTEPSLGHQELDDIQRQLSLFGARLRELRLQNSLTLQELAAQSGVSRAFLSRLESGGRQASIQVALTLSKIFRVSLASFFEITEGDKLCTVIRAADVVEKSVNGLKYAPLSDASRLFNARPMRVKISPARRGNEHYHHRGEEWVYVLQGKLTLSIAGRTFDLDEGDAAHFESHLPHRLIARGECEAEVLVVAAGNWSTQANPKLGEHRSIPAGEFLALRDEYPVPSSSAKRGGKPRLSDRKPNSNKA